MEEKNEEKTESKKEKVDLRTRAIRFFLRFILFILGLYLIGVLFKSEIFQKEILPQGQKIWQEEFQKIKPSILPLFPSPTPQVSPSEKKLHLFLELKETFPQGKTKEPIFLEVIPNENAIFFKLSGISFPKLPFFIPPIFSGDWEKIEFSEKDVKEFQTLKANLETNGIFQKIEKLGEDEKEKSYFFVLDKKAIEKSVSGWEGFSAEDIKNVLKNLENMNGQIWVKKENNLIEKIKFLGKNWEVQLRVENLDLISENKKEEKNLEGIIVSIFKRPFMVEK